MAIKSINVEVAYAMPEKQIIRAVNVDAGTTIGAAIVQSGIMMDFPELELEEDIKEFCQQQLGIQVIKTEECEVVKHTFSHYHLFITPTMVQYESYSDKIMEQTENQWYHKDQSDALGLAAPVSAIIESLFKN